MTDFPHSIIRELERTRNMVIEADSLDELHRVVDQSMRHALACIKDDSRPRNAEGKHHETSLDALIETLANLCLALLDSQDIPRERLLNLLDAALTEHTGSPGAKSCLAY